MQKRRAEETTYLKGMDRSIEKISFHSKDLPNVYPKNGVQRYAMQEYMCGQHLSLFGCAGTGKTFLALYLALRDVLDKDSEVEQIIIVRSAVPVRDIGFLPGTEEEKTEVYEQPYRAICDELFPFKRSYNSLKRLGKIRFITTSYIRGLTFNNAVIVVDECQSLTAHELDSIVTRIGMDSKLIICGDGDQTDLVKSRDRSGFHQFVKILESINSFSIIGFTEREIVRSGFVRDYIVARNRLGLDI